MTRARLHKEKRLRVGGVEPILLTWVCKNITPQKERRPLRGVGPQMLSAGGLE